jgi:hypothetical protein
MEVLNWLWIRFGKTPKLGASNFAAILGAISVAITAGAAKGKLPTEAKDWADIIVPVALTIAGLASGRSSDLKSPQQENKRPSQENAEN